ncbi:HlyD family efflux transporter periplasmic adaptor subunit [Brasilonema sp. UFV-L1]|uniref:HlyD family efflux transporter periplasmic adaptor subunit n=1 Tax=Brasilonema sp. UFV-L1 TaxID=2234130 RepID=UPI00145DA529|nr:HlyD family efflux transporter periplasmic adaptor subunit [Brasilonema sp. UFV-L1]NMG08712.1 HlyD family secretion protein [Brasilonema sp. UFV-L1]
MPHSSQSSSSVLLPPQKVETSEVLHHQTDTLGTDTLGTDTVGKASDWYYATEELLDALPRVWPRSVMYLLLSLSGVVLPWAVLSKVDEIGSARGRLEPLKATQKLDSPVSASVTHVNVKEGESVKSDQILLELDSNVLKTDLEQVLKKLEGLQNKLENLELLKKQLTLSMRTQQQQNQAQQSAQLSRIEQAQQNLNSLKSVYNLQKQEKLAKVNQMQRAVESNKAAEKLAGVSFQASQERVSRYEQAWRDGVMSQDRYLETDQLAKENHERLIKARSDTFQTEESLKEQQSAYQKMLHQAQSEIQQAELRLQQEQRNYQTQLYTGQLAYLKTEEELKQLQTQIKTLQSEINQTKSQEISLNIQLNQRIVRSPIDGVIFAFPFQKPGAVVQVGQMIAQIAAKGDPLVIRAQLPSQESGFLQVGNPVKVKFDAYPFQDYGVVLGHVSRISPDSKVVETKQGNMEIFEVEITLAQSYIQNGSKRILLTPGQTATAEVIVRQRRVIDYVLDPFKKLQKGGLDL